MKVLILTSKNHIYANFILNKLIQKGLFTNDNIVVLEQDWVIPNKSKLRGVIKYYKEAGGYYLISQILKQYIFYLCRFISVKRNKRESRYFPYYVNELPLFTRKIFNGLKSKDAVDHIRNIGPDIILSVFSKEIIPEAIIKIPKNGCVNLHPGYLPFYRGISPTFWCLANKENKAGVTLHYVNTGIDTGPIIFQREIPLSGFKTEHSLYMHCADKGADMIEDFLRAVHKDSGVRLNTLENPASGSYYSLPSREAVKRFREHGYRFFSFKEFFESD